VPGFFIIWVIASLLLLTAREVRVDHVIGIVGRIGRLVVFVLLLLDVLYAHL
jgi:hypothetical protein